MPHRLLPGLAAVAVIACSAEDASRPPPVRTPVDQQARVERTLGHYREATAAADSGAYETEAAHLDSALRILPDSPRLAYLAATAHARAGHADTSLALLAGFVEQGFGLDTDLQADFAALDGDPRFERIVEAIERQRRPRGSAEVAVRLSERDLFPEGLAWDPRSARIYLSSLYKGKVVAAGGDEAARGFVGERQDGLWSTLGLQVDPRRDLLWVASAGQEYLVNLEESDRERSGLFAFRLADGTLYSRHLLDDEYGPHLLNDLAISREGIVYVTDTAEGSVWSLPPDGDLTRLTARGGVPGANGIALSSDEALLYVSWDLGIAVVERATGSVRDLRPPAGATLTGIDGLEYSRGRLVAIQPYLERVSVFGLSRDGWRVDETVVLLSRHADFAFPTTGDVAGDTLFMIANSHVPALDAVGDGTPLPLDDLTGPIVLKIALPD